MEVAGQWRREWAGTAEYGKVTEGGVTRRVARAMEVLHASAPGARVRVMRAAYHSTAGPGAPAASFMLHSSRRVISSGSSFLESPTLMTKHLDSPAYITKPLEISSLPLESSPERYSSAEDYKVTEPDDLDISEPSKWRGSVCGAQPDAASEDSSSADTASVVDLDTRTNGSKNTHRKLSYDSDISDMPSFKKPTSRLSPLLDAPVTLSTLKYKSLINGISDKWNDRRKSFSFEDTSPLNETMVHSNDTLAMESSTDSGICKSTEIVNESDENSQRFLKKEDSNSLQEGSFKEWLARNRATSIRRQSPVKSYWGSRLEELSEDKISLKSQRKVSITIPLNDKTEDKFQYTKNHAEDEADKRTKKVEFCKTELHFAADSGTVNIIATDEKPPPSIDFRRRRSAFVPILGNFEKPITLFGERVVGQSEVDTCEISEKLEAFEYGSTTKSILKNKIPKPKPYLLGENMLLDQEAKQTVKQDAQREYIIPTTVALINEQLCPQERKYIGLSPDKIKQSVQIANDVRNYHASRTTHYGPESSEKDKERKENKMRQIDTTTDYEKILQTSVRQKLKHLETSPILKTKSRPLRDSDLTYFGLPEQSMPKKSRDHQDTNSLDSKTDNYFKSVKLIQNVSNSLGNSEAESEDHDYQNIVFKNKSSAPIPTPRKRVTQSNDIINEFRYNESPQQLGRVRIIKPVIEEDYQVEENRRYRVSRQDKSSKTSKNRSISEPPKHRMIELSIESPKEKRRNEKYSNGSPITKSRDKNTKIEPVIPTQNKSPDEGIPLYANVSAENIIDNKHIPVPSRRSQISANASKQAKSTYNQTEHVLATAAKRADSSSNAETNIHHKPCENKYNSLRRKTVENLENTVAPIRKNHNTKRESEQSSSTSRNNSESVGKKPTIESKQSSQQKVVSDSLSRRRQRHKEQSVSRKRGTNIEVGQEKKEPNYKDTEENADVKDDKGHAKTNRRERSKSKDKTKSKNDSEAVNSLQQKALKKHSDGEKQHKNTNRNDYVINYDDKNGTVTSICKVKSDAPKRKTNKEYHEVPRTNTKSADKRSLLEYQDRHWIQNGYSHADKKWKNRLPVQRTCQIL